MKISKGTLCKITLACIIVFGAFFRLVEPVLYPVLERGGRGEFGDTITYVQIARNLNAGHGFSTRLAPPYQGYTTRGPSYPVFLALVFRIFGENFTMVRVLQGLLGLLTAWMTLVLFHKMLPHRHALSDLIVTLLLFLNPYFIWLSAAILPDSLAAFFLTAFFFFVFGNSNPSRLIAAGLSLGFLLLTRSEFLLFPLAWGMLCLAFRPPAWQKTITTVFLTTLLILAPWTLRNYQVAKRFIPLSSGGIGCSMLLGWAWTPHNFRGFMHIPQENFSSPENAQKASALWFQYWKHFNWEGSIVHDLDHEMLNLALFEMAQNPWRFPKRALEHLGSLWFITPYGLYVDQPRADVAVLILLMSLLGCFCAKNVSLSTRLCFILPAVYISLIMIPLMADSRYSVLTFPLLIPLAGLASESILQKK